jgi:hypothetical protein
MQCVEARERLLAHEAERDAQLDEHLADCARCTHFASGIDRVDDVLRTTLIVSPPLELQHQLSLIVLDAARPRPSPWWTRLPDMLGQLSLANWLPQRPQMIAAQGLAAIMLALASWQVFGWLSAVQPVVGDVGYAVELVIASPATAYLGGLQIDLQTMTLWSLVGVGGWLVSEASPIGRRISSGLLKRS